MDVKRLAPDLSVAGQIRPADLAALARAGFRSVICNRPDGEGTDQPGFPEIDTAARAAGIEAHYLPVVSGRVSDGDAAAFGALLAGLPGPVLAYCRTGTRSTTLWSLSEAARGRPLPDILSAAEAAGYDMTGAVRRVAAGGRPPGMPPTSSTASSSSVAGPAASRWRRASRRAGPISTSR